MVKKGPKVVVEVRISESTLMDMVNSGHTPSDLIPELVEDAWARMNLRDGCEARSANSQKLEWDEGGFSDYMNALLAEGEDYMVAGGNSHGFEDASDLIALLLAYWKLGSKPTSQQLMECLRFTPGEALHTYLRTSKLRLTVRARGVGRPPLFSNPYGLGPDRVHPLKPEVYTWLERWVASLEKHPGGDDDAHVEGLPERLRIFEVPPPRPDSFVTLG